MKRGDRWDTGRLTAPGWRFVVDLQAGGEQGLYIWASIGRRYFWVKLIREKKDWR